MSEFVYQPRQRALRDLSHIEAQAKMHFIDALVAQVFHVPRRDLVAPTRRSARVAFARQVAMYLAHVVCGQTLTGIGTHYGRDRTTVAHACRTIEDRRDDNTLDRSLDFLEAALRSWVRAQIQSEAA